MRKVSAFYKLIPKLQVQEVMENVHKLYGIKDKKDKHRIRKTAVKKDSYSQGNTGLSHSQVMPLS